ncbi:MAG: phosphate acyltransferase PlsX [Ruminococcaceae bacterium]|nr:phosphate acyltransferase PlsX [Oscillospiraceae bacterium]
MRIIVDAFGGDNAPLEIIKGCELAVKAHDVDILLVGKEETIRKVAAENKISLDRMEILDAPDVIAMEDHPNLIRTEKKNCSLAVAMRALAEGKGDGFVGAGNTGATLFGATTIVGRIKGVKRPALAPVMPKMEGKFILCDSGANADCRPEMLVQFGKMASIYAERVLGVNNPRVGLANVGTEDTKGDALRTETFPLMKESGLNFIGNIEARDIPYDACDVVVADGFTGNVILKLYEGVAGALIKKIKGVLTASGKNKIAALMIKKDMKKMAKQLDHNEQGGAPFLGVVKPVFKAHGSSQAKTVSNAIGQVKAFVTAGVIEAIAESVK